MDYLLLPFRVIWMSKWNYTHFYGVISRAWIVLVPVSVIFGLKKPAVRRGAFCRLALFLLLGLWHSTNAPYNPSPYHDFSGCGHHRFGPYLQD